MEYRRPFDPYGTHRVLEPAGVLPQAARRLDSEHPPFCNELAVEVEWLNIDSASLRQLAESHGSDEERIADRIEEIVDQRGKMENPETGSGGMLLGTVAAVGPEYDGPVDLAVGDRVASLVSLTLTPLNLSRVRRVDLRTNQVGVDARAYLWPSSPVAVMPDDLEERTALSVLDVCGAAERTRRLAEGRSKVLVLGAGKSGGLAVAAARDAVEESARVGCIDRDDQAAGALVDAGVADASSVADATDALEVRRRALELFDGELPEVVVDACNVAGTEPGAVLACREGGSVCFFNMATAFSRTALTAEGVGRDVDLYIGNGYARGHAEYALGLVRRHPVLRRRFGGDLPA